MSIAQRLANLADGLDADGVLSAAKGGTGNTTGGGTTSPTVSQISYSGNDTAANPAGGTTITLSGTNFASGAKVLINNTQVSVVTVVSATQITFTAPALVAGSYILYVVNLDGSTAIAVPGIQYSGTPAWSTPTGSLGTGYETGAVSATLSATSDSAVTYSVTTGTLPTGATLNPNGTISGTSPLVSGSTTYTFTVRATDAENQDTDREFSLTVNPDVVSWSSPTNGATLSGTPNTAYSSNLLATSAAGSSISYSADTLPAGLAISGSTITGTPTAAGTSTTTLTATAATTSKTAQITINWTINVANDSYFKYNTLLLNAETTAAPFIADASTNNFALTAFGDTKPNNFNPYTPGYYSVQFNGTSDYLSIPHSSTLEIGAYGGYSIECWVYMTSSTAGQYIWNKNGVSNSKHPSIALQWDGTKFRIVYGDSSALSTVSYVNFNTIPNVINNWVHLATQVNGSQIQSWVNGVYQPEITVPTTPVDSGRPFFIGGQSGATSNATGLFTGYISNLRLIMGGFYYDGSTTARSLPPLPTSPVQSVSINSYYFASGETQLVACNSNRLLDLSANNHTVNKVGSPKIQAFNPYTSNSNYATYGSSYFDGTGDYLTIPGNAAFSVGAGDYTVEAWIYPTAVGNNKFLFGFGQNSGSLNISLGPNTAEKLCVFRAGVAFDLESTANIVANQWTHIAITKASGTTKIWINGQNSGTSATAYTYADASTTVTSIGTRPSLTIEYFVGYMTDVRLVKGTAVYTANFTPPTAPLTAVTNTSLLTCQTNQPNTNSIFLDNSSNTFAVTRSGNITQGSFSPYGANWSNYFDGSGDYVVVPAGNAIVGTGDFTVELWVYHTAANAWAGYYYQGEGGSGGGINFRKNTSNQLSLSHDGVIDVITSTATVPINQWAHVAVTRSSGTVRLFIDGVVVGTTSYTANFTGSTGQQTIGSITSGLFFHAGYISNFRAVKGTAVYTAAFTPATAPLTAIAGTEILTCQSASLIDNSIKANTVTKGGDVSTQRFSPFAPTVQTPQTYSTYFDGSGDYLTLPSNQSQFSMGTGDFTIEMWVNITSLSSARTLYDTSNAGDTNPTGRFAIQVSTGGTVQVFTAAGSIFTSGGTLATNTWYHLAVTKASNSTRIFVNGTQVNTTYTDTNTYTVGTSNRPIIGVNSYDNSTAPMLGYISNLRVVKGTAIYTTNFTAPTAPLTAVAGTSLLTCQSPTIVDNSANRFTITSTGDARAREQNPFGLTTSTPEYSTQVYGSSAYFDGSDYLELPADSLPLKMNSADFTIEFWVYPTTGPNHSWTPFLTFGTSGGGKEIRISQNIDGTGYGYLIPNNAGSSDTYVGFGTLPTNQWHHIALVRSGSTVKFYRNGVVVGTTTSVSFNHTTNSGNRIGHPQAAYADGSYIGYISDVRVVKAALYTSNFVPPQAPLTTVPNTMLLMNMDKAAIVDKSGKGNLETVGDTKFSTTIKKYSSQSMYFDGTGDYLVGPNNPNTDFGTGAFTVECWMYKLSTAGDTDWRILGGSTTGSFFFGGRDTYKLGIGRSAVAWDLQSPDNVYAPNIWNHIAYVRDNSGNINIYVNGTSVASTTNSNNYGLNGGTLQICAEKAGQFFGGYIDDLRITKGYARYTANFTPPTEALLTK